MKRKTNKTFLSLKSEGDKVRVCVHKGALAPYPVPPDKGFILSGMEKLPKADGIVVALTTKYKKLWVEVVESGKPRVFSGYSQIPLSPQEAICTSFYPRIRAVIRAVMQGRSLAKIAEAVETPSQMSRRKKTLMRREGFPI